MRPHSAVVEENRIPGKRCSISAIPPQKGKLDGRICSSGRIILVSVSHSPNFFLRRFRNAGACQTLLVFRRLIFHCHLLPTYYLYACSTLDARNRYSTSCYTRRAEPILDQLLYSTRGTDTQPVVICIEVEQAQTQQGKQILGRFQLRKYTTDCWCWSCKIFETA